MKIPRYSSTALPTKSTLDPQTAAAAAAAPFAFAADAAGITGQLIGEIYKADQGSKAASAFAKAEAETKMFVAAPDWETDSTPDIRDAMGNVTKKGRPTEEAKLDQWTELKKRVSGYTEGITSKSVRVDVEAKIAGQMFAAELAIRAKVDKLQVRRGANRDIDTWTLLQQQGNFADAAQVIKDSADRGYMTPAQRKAALENNREQKALKPYYDAIKTGNRDTINFAASQALDDMTIADADKRMDTYKLLLAESKRLKVAEENDPALEDRYRELLPDALSGDLSIFGAIAAGDALTDRRFDNLITIIKGRDDSVDGAGGTNSIGQKVLDDTLRDVLNYANRDPSIPYDMQLESAKMAIMSNGNIGREDIAKAIKEIDALSKVLRANPDWQQLLNVERAAITGMTAGGMFTLSGDKDIEAEAFELMSLNFWRAAMTAGPGFNADGWMKDNRFVYRYKALAVKADKGGWQIATSADGKRFDAVITNENIYKEAKRRNSLDENNDDYLNREAAERWLARQRKSVDSIVGGM